MANLKLYMTPGSCSTGIHILMEELELIFEAHIINLPKGEQYKADYIAVNPKSTIPALVKEDGGSLTEFTAIAYWLARRYPKKNLLADELESDTLILETMNYIVNTIHMQGFTRIFTPSNYFFNTDDEARVKAQGEIIVKKGFALINKQLTDKAFIADNFSIADAALFYCEFWAVRIGMDLPENCQAHYQRMLKRPAVRQVLMEEGYSSVFQ